MTGLLSSFPDPLVHKEMGRKVPMEQESESYDEEWNGG